VLRKASAAPLERSTPLRSAACPAAASQRAASASQSFCEDVPTAVERLAYHHWVNGPRWFSSSRSARVLSLLAGLAGSCVISAVRRAHVGSVSPSGR